MNRDNVVEIGNTQIGHTGSAHIAIVLTLQTAIQGGLAYARRTLAL
jgi:hypothetical protein